MKKTVFRILKYCKPYRGCLIMTMLCTLIGVSLSLLVPILIGEAVDCAVGQGNVNFDGLARIALILAAAVLVSGVFQWISGLFINRLAFGTVKDLRTELTAKLEEVPLRYIDGNARGDMIARVISDIEIISDGLLQGFAQLFTGVVTIVGTLLFMLTINVKITAIVVLMTPISFFVASKITTLSHNSFQRQSALRGEMGGLTEEMIGGQKIVKAFAYEDRAVERFETLNRELGDASLKATFFSSMSNPSTRFVNGLIYAAVGTVGALGAIGVLPWVGVMSVGRLASFLSYSNQYTKPFNEISGVIAELQNAVSCAQRVFEVLDTPSEPDDSHLETLTDCNGTLEFRDVHFSYVPEKPLIHNFSMRAQDGQRIAIVGPTGCGKSTIINLLLRFYEVDSGCITLDGKPTTSLTRDSLRSRFGMVLQETWIFTGTVAENIAYGKPDATREEIERAAKAAYAHGFIKRLPNGYDTVISDTSGLSQGQKQLLCIARIMLTDPPMLILDEATSSIDIRTEQRIQRAFEALMKGKTSFIIAHRLSTIRSADHILVMRDGNIIEQGNHEKLMQQGGFYANLYQSQFAQ
ncbi:MAG: ABC transporter ATP-binding protein [Oscillospiraceae bacterium]|nr:ABC transporter ATP-binding protein [Oscillospiraceae bacterium]MBR4100684.1 ABC transporter ATP-binding protein [Oscillospiraceae bacterium]